MNQLLAKVEFKFSGGVLRVIKCEKEEQFTFLDYIFNGLQKQVRPGVERNQYLQAITAVGQVLENYSSDKRISTLGFGAMVPGLIPATSHCFALNGNIFSPEVASLKGAIECMTVCVENA